MAVGLVFMAWGAVMLWLSWLMSRRDLPVGSPWGLHTAWARASDEDWFVAHEVFAGGHGVAAGALVLGGLAVGVLGLDNPIGPVVLVLSIAVALGSGAWALTRARRAVEAPTAD